MGGESERPHDTWVLAGDGPESKVRHRLRPGATTVGSAPESDLRLVHPTVSRWHAVLVCGSEGVTVEDLGSAHGTKVAGRPAVGRVRIEGDSTTFSFGEVQLNLARSRAVRGERVADASARHECSSDALGPTTIGFLRHEGIEISFGEGDVIIRRGQRQDSLYVVIDGEVEIVLQEGAAQRRPLARLGIGATFGAESVLGREGAAADAVALSNVRLLRYPASALETALRESASFRSKLLRGIARGFHDATEDALDLLKATDIITRLVQGEDDLHEFVVVSARMRAVENRIARCASSKEPVLVIGASGTGKTHAARLIHERSARRGGPLIAVNCSRLAPNHATDLVLGAAAGRGPRSALRSGGIHFAAGGTLILRDVDALPRSSQEALADYLESSSRDAVTWADTRIIATVRSADPEDPNGGDLSARLLRRFSEVVVVPSLQERPRDILPLAEAFATNCGPPRRTFSESARHALLEADYRRNNVAELREIVELACRIAEADEIDAEHILGGGRAEELPPGIDLLVASRMPKWLQPAWVRTLRVVTAIAFFVVIIAGLVAAESDVGVLANALIWSVWEPVVFASFLLVGAVWCLVCPLSTVGRLVGKRFSLGRTPQKWMHRTGPWLAIGGFVVIVWSEHVFAMFRNPRPAALMLGALVLAAVAFALVYRREAWCRDLCPLGRLAVALSPAAPLQLTANRSVCASSCETHDCFCGTATVPGCTVFHHPMEAKKAHNCKLCLDCLHSCPHGSSRLQLRPPLAAIWRLDGAASDVAVFAYAISFLALAMLLPRRLPSLEQPLAFTVLCLVAIALGGVVHQGVRRLFSSGADGKATATRIGFALMLLGWSALMVGQLENLPFVAGSTVGLARTAWWPTWLPSSFAGSTLLQVGLVGSTTVAAMIVLWRASRQRPGSSSLVWLAVVGVFAVFSVSAIALALAT